MWATYHTYFLFCTLTVEIWREVLKVKFFLGNVLVREPQANQFDLPALKMSKLCFAQREEKKIPHFPWLSLCEAAAGWWTPESPSWQAPIGQQLCKIRQNKEKQAETRKKEEKHKSEIEPAALLLVSAVGEDRLCPRDAFLASRSETSALRPLPRRCRTPWTPCWIFIVEKTCEKSKIVQKKTPCGHPWHSNVGEMLCGSPKHRVPFKLES